MAEPPYAMIDRTISHSRVSEKLGAGGMGVVYLAEDTRLHRFVALRFLPEAVAQDPQALSRLQREARRVSAEPSQYRHNLRCRRRRWPCVHGHGMPRRMMLKHAIAGKAPEPEKVLSLGIEIADALDAAHGEGLIHRHVKPANIFATKRGHAKVFGLWLGESNGKSGSQRRSRERGGRVGC